MEVAGGGDGDSDKTRFQLQTKGELTIAGTTRTLETPLTIEVLDQTHLRISVRIALKMSDYHIERPQALGGLIRAGDKVIVEVAWIVGSAESAAARPNEQRNRSS